MTIETTQKIFIAKMLAQAVTIALLVVPHRSQAQEDPKVAFEQVATQCEGVPYQQRIRVRVARFSVTTRDAQREFGDELATMLSNALQEVNCFRVLESVNNISDMTDELAFGQQGYTAGGSSPQTGKMLGAQVVVSGEVTEFAQGNNSVKLLGIGGVSSKAHIGFILKVLNPQTGEIVFSKSIDVDGRANGVNGAQILGITMRGDRKGNVALTDAIEKGVIKAVEVLATNKDNFGVTPNSEVASAKVWNATNCSLLRGGNAPKMMIIIPETHITGRIPDPAAETEIIKKFVNAGFPVVDPTTYAALRGDELLQEALQDMSIAAQLGVDYGADIVIIGEAVSQVVEGGNIQDNNMVACRARVEARAVQTANGQIIAADGKHAGGIDVAESTSSKTALRNAGEMIADAFLQSLCTGTITASTAATSGMQASIARAQASSTTQIKITGSTFSAVNSLYTAIKSMSDVQNVERAFSGSEGTLTVEHTGSFDGFVDKIAATADGNFEITDVGDGLIGLRSNN